MAKGINIPFTIQGLKENREQLAKMKKEIKEVSDVKASQKLAKEINELSDSIDGATKELIDLNKAGKLVGTRFDDLNEVLFETKEEVLPLTSQIGEMEDRMYQLAASGDTTSDEFKALQGETVRLRKVIRETDKSVDLLAENQGLSVFAEG
jgi:chromosome segregation ATPase